MSGLTPRPEETSSFGRCGLWTVGWQGTDVFGPAGRPLDEDAMEHLLGAR